MKPSSTLLDPDGPGICPLAAAGSAVSHGIVSQAVLTAPGLRVTWFRFAAGQELSEHVTPARALVQVVAGEGEFTFAGRTAKLRAGELLHLPPGMPHAVSATREMTVLLTQVFPAAAGNKGATRPRPP